MRRKSDFPGKDRSNEHSAEEGIMEIVVLSMLQRKDFYGYELVTEISKYIEMSGNNAGGNNSPSAVNS